MLPVTNSEARCGKKCASSYIGEQFGENRVGGKWLMGEGLRIPLTLSGSRKGRLGVEIILLNCCKRLQINSTFFRAVTGRLRSGDSAAQVDCGADADRYGHRGQYRAPSSGSRAKTNAKPQAPSNQAPSSNSNLRVAPLHASILSSAINDSTRRRGEERIGWKAHCPKRSFGPIT